MQQRVDPPSPPLRDRRSDNRRRRSRGSGRGPGASPRPGSAGRDRPRPARDRVPGTGNAPRRTTGRPGAGPRPAARPSEARRPIPASRWRTGCALLPAAAGAEAGRPRRPSAGNEGEDSRRTLPCPDRSHGRTPRRRFPAGRASGPGASPRRVMEKRISVGGPEIRILCAVEVRIEVIRHQLTSFPPLRRAW